MRKITLLLLALILFVAGCGDATPSEVAPAVETTTTFRPLPTYDRATVPPTTTTMVPTTTTALITDESITVILWRITVEDQGLDTSTFSDELVVRLAIAICDFAKVADNNDDMYIATQVLAASTDFTQGEVATMIGASMGGFCEDDFERLYG